MTTYETRVFVPSRTAADTGVVNESGLQAATREAVRAVHDEFFSLHPSGTTFALKYDVEGTRDNQILMLRAWIMGTEPDVPGQTVVNTSPPTTDQ